VSELRDKVAVFQFMDRDVTGGKVEDLRIDIPVEITFDDVTGEVLLAGFKPVS
jgi:hypothetical protein